MPETHALLSASSSKQWLHCPPSVRLQEGFPNVSSVYAEEGTFAHEVCEYKVRKYLQEQMTRPESEQYNTDEIDEITDIYAQFVITAIEEMKQNGSEPLVLVEEQVNYSHIAPEGFGTADMIMIGRTEDGLGVLHVCDFKTGKGVRVEADHNSQMMLYAIGALHAYGYFYPIDTIRMTIIQPRLGNISTFECSRQELEAWGESIKPLARMAYEGKGEQKPGEWCRFCRAKPVCRACMDEALSLCKEQFLVHEDSDSNAVAADTRHDKGSDKSTVPADVTPPIFRQPGLIALSDLSALLPSLERIGAWIEAVFAHVSEEAINHGALIPGYKVVEGRAKRVFSDPSAVAETAIQNGYTDIYKQQMLSITEFEKLMGKKVFHELLGEYVMKPRGKLALVPDDDPRDAVVCLPGSAGCDFSALLSNE